MSFDFDFVEKGVDNGITIGDDDEGFEDELVDDVVIDNAQVEEERVDDDSTTAELIATDTEAKSVPGWDKIDRLTQLQLNADGISLSDADAVKLIDLHNKLDDFDKKPIE